MRAMFIITASGEFGKELVRLLARVIVRYTCLFWLPV